MKRGGKCAQDDQALAAIFLSIKPYWCFFVSFLFLQGRENQRNGGGEG